MTEPRIRRSLKVLLLTACTGIALGLLGSLLRPTANQLSDPHHRVITKRAEGSGLSAAELQDRILEGLLSKAQQNTDFIDSEDFRVLQRLYLRQPQRRAAILERLSADDSPQPLRLAFARALPARPTEAKQAALIALVLPILQTAEPSLTLSAARLLDRNQLLQAQSSTACRCRFARTQQLGAASANWWLAWSLDQSRGIRWNPKPILDPPNGWSLGLTSVPLEQGSAVLRQRAPSHPTGPPLLAANRLPGPHLVGKTAH